MSETKQPKVKAPKFFEVIDGVVPFCPHCGTKFIEPVAANYDYICPACNEPFNVTKAPESEPEE